MRRMGAWARRCKCNYANCGPLPLDDNCRIERIICWCVSAPQCRSTTRIANPVFSNGEIPGCSRSTWRRKQRYRLSTGLCRVVRCSSLTRSLAVVVPIEEPGTSMFTATGHKPQTRMTVGTGKLAARPRPTGLNATSATPLAGDALVWRDLIVFYGAVVVNRCGNS